MIVMGMMRRCKTRSHTELGGGPYVPDDFIIMELQYPRLKEPSLPVVNHVVH
jgi:hypothetical protein